MNIKIIREKNLLPHLAETGGEYAVNTVEIYVDDELPSRTQHLLIIHSVIESYCPSWPHAKIDELVGFIEEALDKLEGNEYNEGYGKGDENNGR